MNKTIPVIILFSLAINACQTLPTNNKTDAKSRFVNNGNGTITDNKTGLMWKRCTEPTYYSKNPNYVDKFECYHNEKPYKWNDAMTAFDDFKFAGYSDWRLPTIDELRSIVKCRNGAVLTPNGEDDCSTHDKKYGDPYDPSIDKTVFPRTDVHSTYLSSTSIKGHENYNWSKAYAITFWKGTKYTTQKTDGNGRVRLVRNIK